MKWMARQWLWVLGVLVLVGGTAAACYLLPEQMSREIFVEDSEPGPPRELERVECLGLVDVERGLVHLFPTQSGRIVEIRAQEGQTVSSGSVLLRLDDRQARFQVEEARASLDSARAQLAQAKKKGELHPFLIAQQQAGLKAVQEQLSAARFALKRIERLHDNGFKNPEELGAARDDVERLQALVVVEKEKLTSLQRQEPQLAENVARAAVAAREATLSQAQYQLEQCSLTAPEPGSILDITVSVGDLIGPQTQQPAILFLPDRPTLVKAEIEQEFAAYVKTGQSAVIHDELHPDKTWTGTVKRLADWYSQERHIRDQPRQYSDVSTLECLISFDAKDPKVRFGQRMIVSIRVK